jgi:ATP-dependent RNA helicase HrpA
MHLIRRYATRGIAEVAYDPKRKGGQVVIKRTLEYFGFELEREVEVLEEFTPDTAVRARRALAEALARGEARHHAAKRNRAAIDEVRETYRRSGGETPRLRFSDLTDWYESRLGDVKSLSEFRDTRLTFDPDELVPRDVRERYAKLPATTIIRDREIDIDYDVEESADEKKIGVARLRLPEKLARTVSEAELPDLGRPLRFVVIRGQRGALRASSLDELQDLLDEPWSPDEIEAETSDEAYHASRDERDARDMAFKRRRGGKARGSNVRGSKVRGAKRGRRFRPR